MHCTLVTTPQLTEVLGLYLSIRVLPMCLTILIMRQTYFRWQNLEIFIAESTTLLTIFWNSALQLVEGGIASVVTSSGTGALTTALLVLLKAGDHIVSSNSLYGGTYNLFSVTSPQVGYYNHICGPFRSG